jgi:2'-5' RNA ligase
MRLFFASWPPPAVAHALARWAAEAQRDCGGHAAREELIHLTLAFLGDAQPEPALELARRVRAAPSSFVLTEARYWGHHRIVWVGPKECPPRLAALARELGETREFAAHVTLLRKARAPRRLPELPALEWPVKEFFLMNSHLGPEGPSYEVLGRYALV